MHVFLFDDFCFFYFDASPQGSIPATCFSWASITRKTGYTGHSGFRLWNLLNYQRVFSKDMKVEGVWGGSLEWQNLAINPPANQDMENPNIKLDQIRWVFPSSATFAKPLFRASLDPLEALEPRLWCASPHQLQDHSAFGLHDRCLAKAVAQAGTTTGSIAGNRWLWEGRYPMI